MDWNVHEDTQGWWLTGGGYRHGPFETNEAAWRWADRHERRTSWKEDYYPPLEGQK